jgi:hypothetical protein
MSKVPLVVLFCIVEGEGRDSSIPGSYDMAMRDAGLTTKQFLQWAHDNMNCNCKKKIFKK